jgi:3-phytase
MKAPPSRHVVFFFRTASFVLGLALACPAACGDDDDGAPGASGRGGSAGRAGASGGGGSGAGSAGSAGAAGGRSGAGGGPGAGGSAGAGGTVGAPLALAFLDDVNFRAPGGGGAGGVAGGGLYPFGGLSGAFYDEAGGTLYAISDGRGAPAQGPMRFYALGVSLTEGVIDVTHDDARAVLLKDASGAPFAAGSLDPEGLAPAPNGGFFVSSEGDVSNPERVIAPAIFRVGADGKFAAAVPVPSRYVPVFEGTTQKAGVRNNGAFECLTVTPDGRSLFGCVEVPVVQDGPAADYGRGGVTRLLRYSLSADGAATPGPEYAYELEPVPGADPGPKPDGSPRFRLSGLVDLLPIDETRLLALERATGEDAQGVFNNFVKIFEVTLEGATDLAAENVTPASAVRVKKRLVLDLNAIANEFEEGFRLVDNFEGITFGPGLPSGKRSLLVVSDDNFSASQRTAFLAFEVSGL